MTRVVVVGSTYKKPFVQCSVTLLAVTLTSACGGGIVEESQFESTSPEVMVTGSPSLNAAEAEAAPPRVDEATSTVDHATAWSLSSNPVSCGYGYVDADFDGYGAGTYGCYSENVVQNNYDCCDRDARAYPGATAGYSGFNGCGSWDYNCDGSVSPTNASAHYPYNTGGLAASYSNGSTCTRGNYSGFYRTPGVAVTAAHCGTNVKIQPCYLYYYAYANCTGLIGYHYCTDRQVLCN